MLGTLLVLAFVAALVCAGILAARSEARPDWASAPALAEIARWTARWRRVGLGAGLVLGSLTLLTATAGSVGLGRFALTAPAVGAACLLAATAWGEATAQPTRSDRRTASLRTRSLASLVSRREGVVAGFGVVAVLVTLLVAIRAGSADDLGRAGRAITASCVVPGSGRVTVVASPWPGSFYALPAGLAISACLVLFGLAVAAVVRRSSPDASSADVDLWLRRRAMSHLLGAVGVLAYGTLAPVLAVMAMVAPSPCAAPTNVRLGLGLLAVGAFVLALALLSRLMRTGYASGPLARAADPAEQSA